MKCKITKKPLKPFMSFGKMPIANGFIDEKISLMNIFSTWRSYLTSNYHYSN